MARIFCLPIFGRKCKGKVVEAAPTKATPPWEAFTAPVNKDASMTAHEKLRSLVWIEMATPKDGMLASMEASMHEGKVDGLDALAGPIALMKASVDEPKVHGIDGLARQADYENEMQDDTAVNGNDHNIGAHLFSGSSDLVHRSEQDYGGSLQGYPSCLTEGSPSDADHLTVSDPGTMPGARQLQDYGRSCSGVFSEMKPSEENESYGHRLSDYSLNSGLVDGSYAPTEVPLQAHEKLSCTVRTPASTRLVQQGFATTKSEGSARSVDDGVMFGMGTEDGGMSGPPKKPWWKATLRAHRSVPLSASKQASTTPCILPPPEKTSAPLHQLGFYGSDGEDCGGIVSPPSANDTGLCRSGGSAASSGGASAVQTGHVQDEIQQVPAGTVDGVAVDSGTIDGAWRYSPPHLNGLQTNSGFTFPGKERVEEWFANFDSEEELPLTDVTPPRRPLDCSEDLAGRQAKEASGRSSGQSDGPLDVDTAMAVAAARALHPLATVAHYSGTGLRVVPPFAHFTMLKTINLSSNSLVRIPPGCFPKSVHCLDLSRNKIVAIEGLRELTKLRTLNLSSNRITRIGHGLAHCTSLRELYLGANRISEVEGLHRLLKLTILDVSYNKVAEVAGLNQLAAHYLSLQELNVTGNGLCKNMGEEQLRKFIGGLCPSVNYLNKQPLKSFTRGDGVAKVGSTNGHHTQRGMKSSGKAAKKAGNVQLIAPGHKRTGSGDPSKTSIYGAMLSQVGQNGKSHGSLASSRHRQGHGYHHHHHHHHRDKHGRRSVETSPVVHVESSDSQDRIPRIQSDSALNQQDVPADVC